MSIRSLLRRLARSERGVALVEFAIALPILIMLFAVIFEGGRMMWSYQTAVAGVRDAARFVGRVVPSNYCGSGASVSTYVTNATLADIVSKNINQTSVLPSQVELDMSPSPGVTATVACVNGTFRIPSTPVATVSATVRINFPFAGLFAIVGAGFRPYLVTTISDKSRVFGS